MANPTGRQLSIALSALFGPANGNYRELLNYSEPTSSIAGQCSENTIKVATGATNFAVNLATFLPAITAGALITLKDVTGPSGAKVSFSPANTGTKLILAAAGAMVLRTDGTLPTLYFDNSSGLDAFIEVTLAGT